MLLLKNRSFFFLWIGQVISQVGNNFNYVALAWLVLSMTGSVIKMGGVMLAQMLPNAFFGFFLGVLVDRLDRKKLMILCDGLRAALVASIPLLFALKFLSLWYIYGVVFTVSTLSLIFTAAEKAVIPLLVEEARLAEANALQETTSQIAGLIGPVTAGILVMLLPSPAYVLYIDASSFVVSMATLLFVSFSPQPPSSSPLTPVGLLDDMKKGILFMTRERKLFLIILTAMAINFCVYPVFIAFPIFSKEILQMASEGFGYLLGAFGLGMLCGSFLTPWLMRRLASSTIIYGGMAVVGFALFTLSFQRDLGPALLSAFFMGSMISPGNVVIISLAQMKTPASMHGRIFSVMLSLSALASPAGLALASPLIESFGVCNLLRGMGMLAVASAGFGFVVFSRDQEKSLIKASREVN
jgi:MFS transporter, DHA3 family, macrolide efflux protein